MLWNMPMLAVTRDGRWHFGIGDPTLVGWLTVVAYAWVLFCSWRRMCSPANDGKAWYYWMLLTICLLFLGVNKQLDLQTWVTQVGRDWFKSHGMYAKRRLYQVWFIGLIASAGVVLFLLVGTWVWLFCRRAFLSLLGAVLLGSFVVIRAASFHHMDRLLGPPHLLGVLRINHVLELGALSIVWLGTWVDQCLEGATRRRRVHAAALVDGSQ